MAHITPTSTTFTDLELQWFRGGIRVTGVINLVTEDDIVGEGDFMCNLCHSVVDVDGCRPCGSLGIHCITCIEDYDLHVQ